MSQGVDPVSAILPDTLSLSSFWRDCSAWRVLDTRFGNGLDFLSTWQAWRSDAYSPKLLHYVALTDCPADLGDLMACAGGVADTQAIVDELACHWFELRPGFHRFSLNEGRVLLTLCVGELSPMLRQQKFLADAICLKPGLEGSLWDLWTVKLLVRSCRRGTRLIGAGLSGSLCHDLAQCGFEFDSNQDPDVTSVMLGKFNPRWAIKHGRSALSTISQHPNNLLTHGTCAVIGAGLAGTGVAAALARRGWQVQVLDAEAYPAGGASGLPAGLIVPHVSEDDCTLSRLSRSGVRLMLQQMRSLLIEGQDWDASGTLERRMESALGDSAVEIWHAQAAWLKPAQMVQAWLAQPGVSFKGGARAEGLHREGKEWVVVDAAGQALARADRVVIANAMGALPLMASLQEQGLAIAPLPELQGVRGQVSWGLHAGLSDDAFPPFPVNGAGSVIPRVPSAQGPVWFVGANYQPQAQKALPPAENHRANLNRLSRLLPALGITLSPRFSAGWVNSWQNIRCVTADRLPLVGPLMAPMAGETHSSVWLCIGMGSRGLTFSALCAELLAAQWHGEPLPLEASLAAALDSRRYTKLSRQK